MRLFQDRCGNKGSSLHPCMVPVDMVKWILLQSHSLVPTISQQIHSSPHKFFSMLAALDLKQKSNRSDTY